LYIGSLLQPSCPCTYLVSIISTIHVIEFFKLSNPQWLAISLAIAFELGAAASLASLVILDKMNKTLVWMLFGTITLMQMQGNMYYAFVHMEDFQGWSELFGLIEEDVVYQKRVLSAVSGAILPLVALGFIKSLVDYIKPEPQVETVVEEVAKAEETQIETKEEIYTQDDLEEEKEWDVTLMDGLEEEPMGEEVEERDEEHELDLVLNEIAEDLQEELPQVEEPINEETPQVVSGYYGDIVIDGNGIQAEESNILPVNSNVPGKNTGIIDNAGSVHLNPTETIRRLKWM
jgi:Cu/Ag efflux pump CusA